LGSNDILGACPSIRRGRVPGFTVAPVDKYPLNLPIGATSAKKLIHQPGNRELACGKLKNLLDSIYII
jgi:hypothetical protein